jgi:hypothetical protein
MAFARKARTTSGAGLRCIPAAAALPKRLPSSKIRPVLENGAALASAKGSIATTLFTLRERASPQTGIATKIPASNNGIIESPGQRVSGGTGQRPRLSSQDGSLGGIAIMTVPVKTRVCTSRAVASHRVEMRVIVTGEAAGTTVAQPGHFTWASPRRPSRAGARPHSLEARPRTRLPQSRRSRELTDRRFPAL